MKNNPIIPEKIRFVGNDETHKFPPMSHAGAIKDAGDWKASVDLTLARHGKELNQLAKAMEAGLSEAYEDLNSLRGHARELRESIEHHRTILWINLALMFGLIVAVAALLNR